MQKLYLKTGVIATLICIQALAALAAWWTLDQIRDNRGIPEGVKINDVPVGGLNRRDAEKLLKKEFDAEILEPFFISASGEKAKVSPGDIEMNIDYSEALQSALELREKTGGAQGITREIALLSGLQNIPLEFSFNRQKLRANLENLKSKVDEAPQNATLRWENNRRVIVPETNGRSLDIDATMDKIASSRLPLPVSIEAVVVPRPPDVNAGDLLPLKNILGDCSTDLDRSQPNRFANVLLAANAIDRTLVQPGEIFSFNNQVGERTASNGYQNAPVVDGNMLVDGMGGGVCQVSSTLYNALLVADLEIVERHPHTKAVGYVSPGLDATVVDGQKDLRFRNNRQFPVFITSVLEHNRLNVKIWGVMGDNEPRVIVETKVEPVTPKIVINRNKNLPAGKQVVLDEGERGYAAEVYQVIRGKYGESRKLVSRDYYPPVNRIILMGTGETQTLK